VNQPLNLIWVRYFGNVTKDYLLLFLGESNGHIIALKAESIIDEDIKIIKRNAYRWKNYDLESLCEKLRMTTPISFRSAFRKLNANKILVMKSYSLK